jgi:hypothetical protein
VRRGAKNVVVLAPAHEDVEGLVRKVTLLEGELAQARRAREVAKGKFCGLSDVAADSAQWLVVSEREHREQFEELSFLQARGSKLSRHCWPATGEESPVGVDAGRYPLPH